MALQSCLEVFFCAFIPKTTVSISQNLLNFLENLLNFSKKYLNSSEKLQNAQKTRHCRFKLYKDSALWM